MKRRIGSWLLTFAMVLALLPAGVVPVRAAGYTVSFDANGGTGTAIAAQTTNDSGTITLPENTFTRAGYRFAGWNTLSNGAGSAIADQATVTFSKDITLYAQWVEVFTASFYGNGSTGGSMDYEEKFDRGVPKALPQNQFTRTGYQFTGWNTATDGSGASYADKASVSLTSDLTLYAQWAKEYTVTFDKGTGSGSMTQVTVISPYTLPACAFTAPTNQKFDGWEVGGVKYAAGAQITINGNTTVKALWTDITYTVTFDRQGHGTSVPLQTVKQGGTATEPAAPTETGYTFGGWYREAACTTAWNFTDTINANTTIYAKWTIDSYTVTFDTSGGTPTPDAQTVNYGSKATEPDNNHKPAKANYRFDGWLKDGKTWSFDTFVTENTTLTAKWTALHTVTFATGEGSTVTPQKVAHGEKASVPAEPTRAGYDFAGWYKEEGCINSWDFKRDTVTADVTIYAKWRAGKYTVTFQSNGGSAVAQQSRDYGDKVTRPDDPRKSKNAFVGWYKNDVLTEAWDFDNDTVTSSIKLYAKWTDNVYSVSFNANGGTGKMDQQWVEKTKTVTLSDNTYKRMGYTFKGWNTAADGSGTAYADKQSVTPTGDLALYAQWESDSYAITFDANGGAGEMGKQSVTKGKKTTLNKNDFSRTGYVFVKWNTKADGSGTDYADEAEFTPSADVTLYAQWEKAYVVTFNAKGGLGRMEVQRVAENVPTKLNKNAYTRAGYNFKGWSKYVGAFTADYENESEITLNAQTGDITLYAVWTREVKVTFNANGGEGRMLQQVFTIGVAKELSENAFAREDFTFKGWNTKADGSGEDYTDKQSATLTDNLTLYAIWSPCVTFHANNGTTDKFVQTLQSGAEATLAANRYTRTGYVFKSWNTAANGSGTSYGDKQKITPTGDLELYAIWTPGTYTVRFDGNGGSGSMADQTFTYGTAQPLSANAFKREGRTFRGWSRAIGGDVAFTDRQSAKDLTDVSGKVVTLYAVWSLEPGTAQVRIQQGNSILDSAVSKNGDPYKFSAASGFYNIVLQTNDKTITRLVEVRDGVPLIGSAVLVPETASSVLAVKGDTPDIVVGGLDTAANDNYVQGASVELRLTAESRREDLRDEEQNAIRRISPSDKSLDFFDFTLTKTVNGKTDEGFRQETDGNLTLMIPFQKAATRDVTVYRWHDGSVDTLTANARQSEYIEVTDDMVTIHAKRFCTYAICYTAKNPEVTYSNCPRNHTCPMMPFDDANPMAWYHDGVHWAIDVGAMNGVSPHRFYPNATTNRAQLVTILWRLEGSPRAYYSMIFMDVPQGEWYTEAVRWAASRGIVTGISPRVFNPSGTLTREQLATILYRYIRMKGTDVYRLEAAGLDDFRDASEVQSWARESMDWLATYGIMDGSTNTAGERFLTPQGNATRAMVATVMMRYWSQFVE